MFASTILPCMARGKPVKYILLEEIESPKIKVFLGSTRIPRSICCISLGMGELWSVSQGRLFV